MPAARLAARRLAAAQNVARRERANWRRPNAFDGWMACSSCASTTPHSGGSNNASWDTTVGAPMDDGVPPRGGARGGSPNGGARVGTKNGLRGSPRCMADRISLAAALTEPVTNRIGRAPSANEGSFVDPLAALSARMQCHTVSEGCPVGGVGVLRGRAGTGVYV